jgi:acyl carrier protein
MDAKILDILNNIRPECDFKNSIDFVQDGYLDSFDIIMLVSEMDSSFKISILGEDIIPENFQSVLSIKSLLARYISNL